MAKPALIPSLAGLFCRYHVNRFEAKLNRLEAVQRHKADAYYKAFLHSGVAAELGLRRDSSMESARHALGITDYAFWQPWIERQRDGKGNLLNGLSCERYQPTSGSTSAIKWIPYTKPFIAELNHALLVWMGDLFRRYPGLRCGSQYWSLSWVPDRLRGSKVDEQINDDLSLVQGWFQNVARALVAVPESVAMAPTSDDTLFASLAWLVANENLALMSIWSPSFALGMMTALREHRDEICLVLCTGSWQSRRGALKSVPCPHNPNAASRLAALDTSQPFGSEATQILWPDLALLSSWSTASSAQWAGQLRALFPHAEFQGKGLWATEAVVTIPYNDQYILASTSHYYEFECLDSGNILESWQLRKGQQVAPIISSASGLMRYRLRDCLNVTGFVKSTPCFEFMGRIDGSDMVGEKISSDLAIQILNKLGNEFAAQPLSLIAVQDQQKPLYLVLVKGNTDDLLCRRIGDRLEVLLKEHFHYQLARDLGQLQNACAHLSPDAIEIYELYGMARGMVRGNIKIEALSNWKQPFPEGVHLPSYGAHRAA